MILPGQEDVQVFLCTKVLAQKIQHGFGIELRHKKSQGAAATGVVCGRTDGKC